MLAERVSVIESVDSPARETIRAAAGRAVRGQSSLTCQE